MKSLRILLTGASSGIGAATARLLAKKGHKLFLLARTEEALQAIAAEFEEGQVQWQVADVTRTEDLDHARNTMIQSWGGIDVCIPNAGLGIFSPLKEAQLADWKNMIDVNVQGVLNTLHCALPSLIENRGHVIQIGSIASRNVFANSGVYCATKHAVLAISEALRIEFREELAVTTINPGAVNTGFIDQTRDDALRESYRPQFEAGMDSHFIAEAIATAIEAKGRGIFSEITVRPDRR